MVTGEKGGGRDAAAKRGDAGASSRRDDAPGSRLQRLFWFGALWLGGVVTVSIVAYAIRAMIMP